jgi:Aldo/keto reductase family
MQTTQLKTTQLGDTGLEITRVGFGAWAIGGGGWEFGWDPGGRPVDRRDPPRPGAGDQLDRHRRRLRFRPLRGDRWACAARSIRASPPVHQGLAARGPWPPRCTQPQARLDPARGARQPRAPRRRRDRSLPDPLADPRRGHRGGLVNLRRTQGARARAPHRRLELRRRAAAADPADRAGGDPAAAVLASRSSRAIWRSPTAWPRSPSATAPFSEVVAIAWALRNPAVDGAIVGFRSPEQVDPLIEAANLELSDDDITTIEGAQ